VRSKGGGGGREEAKAEKGKGCSANQVRGKSERHREWKGPRTRKNHQTHHDRRQRERDPKAPPPGRSATRGASKSMLSPSTRRENNIRRPGRGCQDKGKGPEEPDRKVGQSKWDHHTSPGIKSVSHSKVQESAGKGKTDGER
jgi:hypothetical protein